jgi:Thioesterase domains of type I polyketide synthases or non-ribosomal peptide synthetases
VLAYQALADALGSDQPVYGIQSQALLDPSAQLSSIESMMEDYVEVIREHWREDPYFLLGWSMGGVIALAMASRVERLGHTVGFIGLLDTRLRIEEPEALNLIEHFAGFLNPQDRQSLQNLNPGERQVLEEALAYA